MKKKISKLSPFHKYLIITLIIITSLLLGLIYFIGVLPLNYFIFATSIFIVIDGCLILNLLKSKSKNKIVSSLLSIILIVVMMIGIVYEINTINFLKKLGVNISIQNYSVIVLEKDNYTELKELKELDLGILNTKEDSYTKAIKELESEIIFDDKSYQDIIELQEALTTDSVEAILVESSQFSIMEEADEEFAKATKVIYSFDVETINRDIKKEVDITNQPFSVYISGIDTYGAIGTLSRSDVNIVLTVNPNTHKLHITSIPRDYYVKLHSKNGYKDKLTHAGIYGVEESVATIEDLLNIDINYFVKVNFSSMIDIVDTIGPIEVYSDYDFTTGIYDQKSKIFTFNKGLNTLNGEQALAFSRERKSFIGGDRVRNANQEKVLEAIINKCLSPSILTRYNSLLKALSNSFITNFEDEDITRFIKKQIDDNSGWQITSYVMEGTDAKGYTYTYNGNPLYVMEPSKDSVNKAKEYINTIIK